MRVYIDQFAWIQLLGAQEGHPKGKRYEDVLLVLREAVDRGHVSLPLSSIHYIETARRRPFEKRKKLAALMADLSKGHAIAPFYTLARAELRQAIVRYYGSRIVPAAPIPFGRGADHAFSHDVIADFAQRIPAVEQTVRLILEWGAIAGHPDHDNAEHPPLDSLRASMQAEAARLENLRELRTAEGWAKGERSERVWKAVAYTEALDELETAFEEAGVSIRALFDGGIKALNAFLPEVPTMEVRSQLGQLREQSIDKPWTPNDLNDIQALSGALVYADVVVTENSWTSIACRARLPEQHDTIVVSSLDDLLGIVIGNAVVTAS
jgi:hypothetical protein